MKNRIILLIGLFMLITGGLLTLTAFTNKPPQTKRRHINPPSKPGQVPLSEAVMVGDTLYVSGKLGLEPETGKPPADIEKEVRLMMDNLKNTLAKAEMSMDDLVQVQVYCSDLAHYDKFNAIYGGYFKGAPPARAFVGSVGLVRGCRFEIMGIAVKGS